MSWLAPSAAELRALAEARRRWPEVLPLAEVLALSARIKPLLLRNARLHFLGDARPEIESLLWFGPLVAARSSQEIVLHPGVARCLSDQLKERDAQRHEAAWEFLCTHTNSRHWDATDRIEQELRRCAQSGDADGIEARLRDVLRRIVELTQGEERRRIELARWARRTLPQVAAAYPEGAAASLLAQYAGLALGVAAPWNDASGTPARLPRLLEAALPRLPAAGRLALELRRDPGDADAVLHCTAPADDANCIDFPAPLPTKLYVLPANGTGAWHTVAAGTNIPLKGETPVELATLDGRRYRLDAAPADAGAANDREAPASKAFLAHTAADASLARQVAAWLREYGLAVELLDEEARRGALISAAATQGARLLRLWTAASHARAASTGEPAASLVAALLLRQPGSPAPTGAESAGNILDLPDFGRSDRATDERFMAEVRAWIDDERPPPPPRNDERERLLLELRDPSTPPPRRLAIGDRLAEIGDTRPGVGVRTLEVRRTAPDASSAQATKAERLLRELDDPTTEPPRRLEIGDRLAELGDTRPGVGLDAHGRPDIAWVKITGGDFVYQEDKHGGVETFHLARYPVTNAQYQCFIDAGGYENEHWWSGLKKPEPQMSQWPQANRPRTNVNWYEATAFCRWLSAQLGYEVRLPTEEKWERAARGKGGREYPWGEGYEPGRANVNETAWDKPGPWNLRQTSAVGVYPQGETPEGIADLAGNVWEWCSSKYEKPHESGADSSGDSRVLRGGSWSFNPGGARARLRDKYPPGSRLDLIGFRLLSSAPN